MVKLNTPSDEVTLNGRPITEREKAGYDFKRLIRDKSSEDVTMLSFNDERNHPVEHYIEGKPTNVKQDIGKKRVDYNNAKRKRNPEALAKVLTFAFVAAVILFTFVF